MLIWLGVAARRRTPEGLAGPVRPCGSIRVGLDANPDGLALISADARWTWRTLDELSNRLAVGLLGLGLNPGDRVASLMPNRPALIAHYLAVRSGAGRHALITATWLRRSITRWRSAELVPCSRTSSGRRISPQSARPAAAAGHDQVWRQARQRVRLSASSLRERFPLRCRLLLRGACRDLLYLREYRAPEGGHTYSPDARLDVCGGRQGWSSGQAMRFSPARRCRTWVLFTSRSPR